MVVSGPLVGDEASNKAYSRNTLNNSKNPNHVLRHSSPSQDFGGGGDGGGGAGSDDSLTHSGLLPEQNDNGPRGYSRSGNTVRIRLDCPSKDGLREIKWKLMSELEQVRCLMKNVEAKEAQLSDRYGHQPPVADNNNVIDSVKSTMLVDSEAGFGGRGGSGTYRGLSVPVGEKEKKTWKANPCSKNSEFRVGKEKLPPSGSSKKLTSTGRTKNEGVGEPWFRKGKSPSKLFKSCSALLEKLMKHKFGWVFNRPVDVKALGLHDYYKIVKKPMDLGTVKTRLNENWYKTPAGFAEDVRLTFKNAMLYNPKGQDAHLMAEQLLKMFEDKWRDIESEYDMNSRNEMGKNSNLPPPISRKVQAPAPRPMEMRTLDRAESMTKPVNRKLKPVSSGRPGRPPGPKKPKAKDPNKRDMTYEEKQKLSTELQNLPSEKLENVVQIIKKRNPGLSQQDDELEVDIGIVDPETLWELDRFVTYYKKSLNKNKRKAEFDPQSIEEPDHDIQETQSIEEPDHAIHETYVAPARPVAAQEAKEVNPFSFLEVENNNSAFSPVQREEQGDNVSGSSNSSSESGSSSSDSENSSSGCGSDSNH